MLATSTPELKRMRNEAEKRERKKTGVKRKQLAIDQQVKSGATSTMGLRDKGKNRGKKKTSKTRATQRNVEVEEDSSDSDTGVELADSEDSLDMSDNEEFSKLNLDAVNGDGIEINCYVLVESRPINMRGNSTYYIVKVLNQIGEDFEVEFLRKHSKATNKFVLPQVQDIASVALKDVRAILPAPLVQGTTKHNKGGLCSSLDFGPLNIR